MSMRKKRLYCLIFAFLCISFRLLAQGGSEAASDWPSAMAGDSFSDATPDWPSAAPYPMAGDSERFSAALCSMAAWEAGERDVRDSLLLRRAFFLDRAPPPPRPPWNTAPQRNGLRSPPPWSTAPPTAAPGPPLNLPAPAA